MTADEKLDLILNKLESLEATLFFMQEKIEHFEAGYIEPADMQMHIDSEIQHTTETSIEKLELKIEAEAAKLHSTIATYSS